MARTYLSACLARDPNLRAVPRCDSALTVSAQRQAGSRWTVGVVMPIAEKMVRSIPWKSFTESEGEGGILAHSIGSLIAASTPDEAEEAWWGIENVAFAQDSIYAAAEPLVDVLMGALVDERPPFVREWIFEALFTIMKGDSVEDPSLQERCRSRGRRGLWLLAREAASSPATVRARLLEVVDLIDVPFGVALKQALADS